MYRLRSQGKEALAAFFPRQDAGCPRSGSSDPGSQSSSFLPKPLPNAPKTSGSDNQRAARLPHRRCLGSQRGSFSDFFPSDSKPAAATTCAKRVCRTAGAKAVCRSFSFKSAKCSQVRLGPPTPRRSEDRGTPMGCTPPPPPPPPPPPSSTYTTNAPPTPAPANI